jgi:hypothetical protein
VGAEILIPGAAVALTAYYLASTADLSWEAKAAGVLIGSVLLALCGIQLLRILRAAAMGESRLGFGALAADTRDNRRRLGLVLLVLIFISTVEWLGVSLALFLLIAGSMAVMGVRNVRQLILVPGITALTVFVLLVWLLGTRLPWGPFEAAVLPLLGAS